MNKLVSSVHNLRKHAKTIKNCYTLNSLMCVHRAISIAKVKQNMRQGETRIKACSENKEKQ